MRCRVAAPRHPSGLPALPQPHRSGSLGSPSGGGAAALSASPTAASRRGSTLRRPSADGGSRRGDAGALPLSGAGAMGAERLGSQRGIPLRASADGAGSRRGGGNRIKYAVLAAEGGESLRFGVSAGEQGGMNGGANNTRRAKSSIAGVASAIEASKSARSATMLSANISFRMSRPAVSLRCCRSCPRGGRCEGAGSSGDGGGAGRGAQAARDGGCRAPPRLHLLGVPHSTMPDDHCQDNAVGFSWALE